MILNNRTFTQDILLDNQGNGYVSWFENIALDQNGVTNGSKYYINRCDYTGDLYDV